MYEWAELRHFKYLLAILEKQGFRVAAEALHTSQPNLSVQARQFQENASIRLFKKLRNGRIRPTETGIAFIGLARLLLETRDEVINALIAIERGEIRPLRLGCSTLVDRKLFHELCAMHTEILPTCQIKPTHGDSGQLAEEILEGAVDAAILTLPLEHQELRIEEIRRAPLVACLRRDDALASKPILRPGDLNNRLSVLYHPKRHPEAHDRLLELFAEAAIKVRDCSYASHPSEMQMMVKDGHGLTLISKDSVLDPELTTRSIVGCNWTVDTALVYHKFRHPKTVPVLARKLGKCTDSNLKPARENSGNISSLRIPPKRSSQGLPQVSRHLTSSDEIHKLARNGTE